MIYDIEDTDNIDNKLVELDDSSGQNNIMVNGVNKIVRKSGKNVKGRSF